MYRHGLGDCFLLSFPKEKGGYFHVLIDCGLIGVATNPKETMTTVVRNIAQATAGHLDLVVLTHEHWDHVSGLSEQQAQAVFEKAIEVERVWYAWTEDKNNKLGQKLRQERESKARAIHRAAKALQGVSGTRIVSLLTFFGIENAIAEPLAASGEKTTGKVRKAFDYLAGRKGIEISYCHPTDQPRALPGVPGLLVYVLGPPESESLIKRSDPTALGKEVYEIAPGLALEDNLLAAFARFAQDAADVPKDGRDCPFDFYLQRQPAQSSALQKLVADTWDQPNEWYRKIENDWMNAAESLALALDKHTNNTSLVLAFEFTESGKVLLFAADAQVGNWLSWQDLTWEVRQGSEVHTVTGPDLLSRTVLYKVGHHGSHNATLRDKGLEQMVSPELIALVPVNKQQAQTNRWMEMPFNNLIARLEQKTRGRVIQSDSAVSAPGDAQLQQMSDKERRAFQRALKADRRGLYYDLELPI
jgi:beta-lactamase superfamily II metal-dependent hydrolase